MTIVVAFLCSDGAVVAADSMVTASVNGSVSAEYQCQKVSVCPRNRVLGWAGPLDLGLRFQAVMQNHDPSHATSALEHGTSITKNLIHHYEDSGVRLPCELMTAVAFAHDDVAHCHVFGNDMQPLILNPALPFAALGSGKVAADPFLRFLVEIFCREKPPTVGDARFLATWAVSYTIDSLPHVGGPIQLATLEHVNGAFVARELTEAEIDEHRQAVAEAATSLRGWRDSLKAPKTDKGAKPEIPVPPTPPAPPAKERDLE